MQKKQGKGAKVAKGATVAKVTTSKAAKPEGKQPEKASAKAEKPQAAQLGKGATLEDKIKARCAKMGINPNKVIVATVSAKPEAKPEAAKIEAKPEAAKIEAKPEAAKVAKAAKPEAAKAKPEDDARFNDWLREIEGLVLNGRLAEITAEKIARAQGAAKLASREAVLLCLAQVAKLTKDERPKAKRIGELWAKITEARAKELKARWAMGADMPREALKPGVAVVVQHPYKDKRMACMIEAFFQVCDCSWDKAEGKFQVLTMAWTEDGKPEAKQKAPSKPQGTQGKPEAKQGKAKAASLQKAVKAAKAKGAK